MREWKEIELGEVAEVQTGPFGSQLKNKQYITGGTPVVTVEHIQDFRIIDFDYPSITDEDKERLSKYLMKEGDILFTRVGSVDLSAYVSKGQDGWMFSSRMLRVRPNGKINSRFLAYFFQQKSFRDYIVNIAVGATMPSINTGILKTIPISYPSLEKQRAIASVLSSLDDKIDLLHRQNQTLEQMAETLFRQWFVEEANEGWEEGRLGEFISTNETSINKNYPHQEIKYLDTGSLTKGQWGNLQSLHLVDAPSRAKRLVKHNDILYSTVRPNQLHYGIVRNPIENLVVSTGFCVITCKLISPYFVYYLLTDSGMTEYLHSIAEGSTSAYPSLKPSDLEALEISVPPSDILDKFHCFVDETWKKVETNYTQIRTLTALRDTLLPKLMSGEIRIDTDE